MRPARPPRLPDWTERLAALLAERARAPFVWGRTDCAMLAADVVVALTGQDPAAEWRGTYDTEAGADALLRECGGLAALAAQVAAAAGIAECPPAFAQRGDVALVSWLDVRALGVIMPDGVMVLGADGMHCMPARTIQRAWAV